MLSGPLIASFVFARDVAQAFACCMLQCDDAHVVQQRMVVQTCHMPLHVDKKIVFVRVAVASRAH